MTDIKLTISRENAAFQELYSLSVNRTKRYQKSMFIVEGVRPINQCLENQWNINTLIINKDNPNLSDWAQGIIKKLHHENCQIYWMDAALFKKISNKEEAHELMLIVKTKHEQLEIHTLQNNFKILVLDRPQSHGNLGTIIRSADAFGIQAVIVTGHAIDIYDPKVISSSTGSFFAIPVISYPDQTKLFEDIQNIKKLHPDLKILSTDEHGTIPLHEYRIDSPVFILAGNEKWGLNKGLSELSDTTLSITMSGQASSLNVSNAVSIVLYELSRI